MYFHTKCNKMNHLEVVGSWELIVWYMQSERKCDVLATHGLRRGSSVTILSNQCLSQRDCAGLQRTPHAAGYTVTAAMRAPTSVFTGSESA